MNRDGVPRINGPRVYGARLGRQFELVVPVSGREPMQYATQGLPEHFKLDPATGRMSGVAPARGDFPVLISVRNSLGADAATVVLRIGDAIGLTPAMGWNSWNCFGKEIDQGRILSQARAMAASGLAGHGWKYINIDDGWQGARTGRDGALQPNEKFPDMRGLCEEIHSMGLKAGIYSTPWERSYAGFTGGKDHARADARQFAEWGVDYLKYDWHPIDLEAAREMGAALKECGRDIVYSLSNTATFEQAGDYAGAANSWRTTGDITDTWESVSGIGFSQDRWAEFAGPGHFNDPDMLVVGRLGWGQLRATRLSQAEQKMHITMWCLLAAPLLLGCDLTSLDSFTLALLSNDEALAVNQDELGRQARKVPGSDVWVKEMVDGWAVGLFNRGEAASEVRVPLKELGVNSVGMMRDVWRGVEISEIAMFVEGHGGEMIRIVRR